MLLVLDRFLGPDSELTLNESQANRGVTRMEIVLSNAFAGTIRRKQQHDRLMEA